MSESRLVEDELNVCDRVFGIEDDLEPDEAEKMKNTRRAILERVEIDESVVIVGGDATIDMSSHEPVVEVRLTPTQRRRQDNAISLSYLIGVAKQTFARGVYDD